MRVLIPVLVVAVSLAAVAFRALSADARIPSRVARPPIDSSVPRHLSTATFGLG
jgi:hypothetical protein